jgi:nitrate reductase NapAB chaperone NapD
MSIAGALVVPVKQEFTSELQSRLAAVSGVNVEDTGPKGIAIVLEADSTSQLKKISHDIGRWDDVLEIELAYLNWEDEAE